MKDELTEVDLSEHEKLTVARYQEAWTLTRKFMSTADAAAILMKRFPGLSRATAYRDIANATSLFGDISVVKKEGIRHLVTEIFKAALAIAIEQKDPNAIIKAGNAIARANALHVMDPETFDWSKLEPHTYVLGMDSRSVAALKAMISGGKVDLRSMADMMNSEAVDAEIISENTDGAV
jgi:hypothetical protein